MLLASSQVLTPLDNLGHKTPTQSKRKRTGKKGLKGRGPEHVYNTLGYINNETGDCVHFQQLSEYHID